MTFTHWCLIGFFVLQSLVIWVVCIDHRLCSTDHCIISASTIYDLCLPIWDLQPFFLDIMHQITLSYFIYMLRTCWLVHIYVLNIQTYLSCEFNLFLNVFLKVKFTLKEMLNSYNCEVIDHQCSNFLFWFWQFLLFVLISRVRYFLWRVWRCQRGNPSPYIEEKQTTQWLKEKVQKDKQRSTKHTYKTKDRVTRTPLKLRVNSGAPEG